ncbi:unnamed protein product [Prorocentrum cordatum]|uniref:Uncharacterized protein n=1 Tax=Prorocentrum cordatum TaxID=2364126 RepID=A0ABN9Y3Q3_9DINO|nr:unnamed protein product [Polarella glacialis]
MDPPVAPELLEAVLPEDAPAGHEAWQNCKHDRKNTSQALCYFKFGSQRFQATLACCLTEEAMLRVTRACYVQFARGEPKERVLEFRNEIYAKIKGLKRGRAGDAPAGPPEKRRRTAAANGSAAAPPAAGAEEGADVPAPGAAPARSPPAGSPLGEAPRSVLGPVGCDAALAATAASEDAPPGHEAWSRIHYERSRGLVRLHLRILRRPGLERYTTTVKACGGSEEEAMRIARLCWVKFAEGASKEEVSVYRQGLYDAVAPRVAGAPAGEPPARKVARRGAAMSEAAALEAAKLELKTQGRLEGALLVEGRSSEKKNASINGLYARRPADYDGYGAYEKVGADAAIRPRFLYFWREKSRWKIDCKIPSRRSGFAYLKAAGVASPTQAGPDCQWHVCDDKGEGYGKDPCVRCLEVVPAPGATSPAPERVGHHATQARSLPSQDSSASADSSSDDVGNRTSSDEESSSASGAEPPAQPGADAQAPRSHAGRTAPIRACAKMLVRSGLRCACHFRMAQDCPGCPRP